MNIDRISSTLKSLTTRDKVQQREGGKTFQEKKIDGCLTLLDIPISAKSEKKDGERGKPENYDRIELSANGCSGNDSPCNCEVSEEEKVANRRKIDFSGNIHSYDVIKKEFRLMDGTIIPASHVSDKIDPSEIFEFEVKDNKLKLEAEKYYSFTDHKGNVCLLKTSGNPANLTGGSFATKGKGDEYKETPGRKTIDMLNCLVECGSPLGLYLSYNRAEVNELLDYMGFKPGKIEIGVEGGYEREYVWTTKGELWAQGEIDQRIEGINATNLYERGYPPGSAIVVEGVPYKLDEKGYVHIPYGVMYCNDAVDPVRVVDKDGNVIYPQKNKPNKIE